MKSCSTRSGSIIVHRWWECALPLVQDWFSHLAPNPVQYTCQCDGRSTLSFFASVTTKLKVSCVGSSALASIVCRMLSNGWRACFGAVRSICVVMASGPQALSGRCRKVFPSRSKVGVRLLAAWPGPVVVAGS